ncbi:MAG TPA: DUF6498-containing protein, partial [Thermoanaerobaculia bacterium]|nr:DUF6498-containing protein [Thermoanaerobaculia bacterium]
RTLRVLGVSGVPATGYFGAGWSIGTLLLLYWIETILMTMVVAALIVLHRRRTRKAGHWNSSYTVTTTRGGKTTTRYGETTFLKGFLSVMVPFTAAHGLFVVMFAFLVFPQEVGPEAGVSFDALGNGLLAIGLFLLGGLLFDLPGLGERPFRWVESQVTRAQGRMIVTHLTIIFGAGAMAMFEAPLAFLAVFVALKSLVDLGGLFPDRSSKPNANADEKPVPRAVKTLGRRLPKKGGKGFGEAYREAIEEERRKAEANEEVLPPPALS